MNIMTPTKMETDKDKKYIIEELSERLRRVIKERCNSVGCKNCDLDWGDGCSATELQSKIMDLEFDKNGSE